MANKENIVGHLFVTHVDAIENYLRLSGTSNPESMQMLQQKIHSFLLNYMAIDPTWPLERHEFYVQKDLICLYKSVNSSAASNESEFMRVRIIQSTGVTGGPRKSLKVEVEFIDYGYTKEVRSYELLIPNQTELLKKIPPLCNDYILLGICGDWSYEKLNEIKKIVKGHTVEIAIVYELYKQKFIKIKWKGFDFVEYLILHLNIGAAPVNDELLLEYFKENEGEINRNQNKNAINAAKPNMNNNYTNSNKNITNGKVVGDNKNLYQPQKTGTETEVNIQKQSVSSRLKNIQISPPRHPVPAFIGNPLFQSTTIPPQVNLGTRINQNGQFTSPNVSNYYQQHPMTLAAYYSAAVLRQRPPYSVPAIRFTSQPLQPFPLPVKPQFTGSLNNQMVNKKATLATKVPANITVAPPTTNPLRSRTFKTHTLTIGQTYDVHVSYVENGPLLFSIQLESLQDQLCDMMNNIEKEEYELKRLQIAANKPYIGACIARYSEDNHLYRALIINVQQNTCKVVYVDYGNAELVTFNNIFEIPEKYLEEKAFAIPFCLSQSKGLEPMDDSMKKTFADRVTFRPCKLKVVPLEGPPVLQYCELVNEGEDMIKMLKAFQSKRNVYPKAENLNDSDVVEIRYIDSPKRFFVQNIANINSFHNLMDEMYTYYNANQKVPNEIHLGDPCIVKCENDWYRGEVIRDDNAAIVIRHVDFGYEQKVTRNLLSVVNPKHLKMPRQAVQCCLKGFENTDLKKDLATTQFEMLAEDSQFQRRAFSVKVFRIEPNGVNLVNLYTKELNLMKKLYKLSMPFEDYVVLEKSEFNFSKKNNTNPAKANQKTSTSVQSEESRENKKDKSSSLNGKQNQIPSEMNRVQNQNVQIQRSPNKSVSNQKNNKENVAAPQNFSGSQSSSIGSEAKKGKQLFPRSPEKKTAPVSAQGSDNVSLNSSLSTNSMNKSQKSGKSSNPSSNRSPRYNRQQRESQKGMQKPRNGPQGYSHSPSSQSSPRKSEGTPSVSPKPSKTSSIPQKIIEEYIPFDQLFPEQQIEVPATEDVDLCWWVSPYQFYTQLKRALADFQGLNQQMQQFYKNKPSEQFKLKNNSSVVVLHRKDKTFYRARVIATNHMLKKYKVICVDNGRQLLISSEDIWQVEKRFADFPCVAYECSFKGVVSNYDHIHIISIMKNYIPANAQIVCEYCERKNNTYYVNIRMNKLCLKEKFIANNILWPVDPDMCLELLAGQQIRAKFTSITDMLNFKIQIDGCDPNIHFISSYDDIRYVKSNLDASQKFKDFYENKSFVVNIKSVNEHKVIFLRPLMPLFKDNVASYIPTYPITITSFHGQLLYVASSYRFYCVPLDEIKRLKKLYLDMIDYYETDRKPLKHIEKDMVCAGRGGDGRWHRCRVRGVSGKKVEVIFLDHGDTEYFQKDDLKVLDESFYLDSCALAIEVNLPIRTNVDLLHSSKKSNETKSENDLKIEKALNAHLYKPSILIQALEVRNNRLIGDVNLENGSIVDILEKEKLIIGRDIEYIRKVLDKEKPNTWEHIEMVDLTLDEDEDNALQQESATNGVKEPEAKVNEIKVAAVDPVKIKAVENEAIATVHNATIEKVTQGPVDTVAVENLSKELEIEIPETNAEVSSSTPTAKLNEEEITPKSIDNPFAGMEQAVLSHCDNPAQFFVHLQGRIEELYRLQENLQIVARSLPPLMCVVNGANCIALYSVSDQWCRAKILDAELLVLRYTDFGNTDWISDPTEIKEMSVFPDIEPFCIPCALPIRPNGTADWVDAANSIFTDSFYKKLYFEYITRGDYEKKSYINLFIDGVNVADKLVKHGFAKHLVLVDSDESCYISHLNNISDFYIQYEKNSKGLELIECYLTQIDNLKPFTEFEKGKIVAALFPDDEMWYRAELLKILPNGGYEVLFIDYGNTSTSPECRIISEEIANLPPLSTKCALALPEDCLAWSDAAEEKFTEMSATGETIFTIKLIEPASDHAIVQLFIDGSNVNEELRLLCELKVVESEPDLNASFGNTTLQTTIYEPDTLYDATVLNVNSLEDFFIQFDKNSERLSDINATLNTLAMENLENIEVGAMCAINCKDDGLVYRARVVEKLVEKPNLKCRCLLVDYGNEIETETFKALPQDLLQIQDLSKPCQLSGANLYSEKPKEALEALLTLLDECNYSVKVNIIDNETTPAMVKLFNGKNEDFEDKLTKLLGSKESKEEGPFKRCVISNTIAPDHFYLQMKENSDKMDLIAKTLKKTSFKESGTIKEPICLDYWCCVYSSEDDRYYRGRVHIIEQKGYKIFLLDYGNILYTEEIYELPEELTVIPPLAKKCALLDFNCEDQEAFLIERFNELVESHFGEVMELVEDIYDDVDKIHRVRLQVNYKDFTKELIASLSKENGKEKSIIPILHNCNIVYSQSPQTFFIHYEKDLQAIEDLRNALLEIEKNSKKPENIKEGAIVAAYSDEYFEYFRAKILSHVKDDNYAVHFLDYGNDSCSDKILELPENLINIESYATYCSLGNDLNVSSADFKKNFLQYISNLFGETFQIEFINNDSKPYICRLFYQNKDVVQEVIEIVKAQNFLHAENVPLPPSDTSSSGTLLS